MGHCAVVGKHYKVPFEFVVRFFEDGAERMEVGVDVLDFLGESEQRLHRHW